MSKNAKSKLLAFSACAALFLFFSLTTDNFFTWVNINNLIREVSIVGTIAIGMTFVMMGGGIDLSTGSLCGLVMMVEARLLNDLGLTWWLAAIIGIVVGCLCGLFTGFIITTFNIGDFIATLACQLFFRGLVYMVSFHDPTGNLITKTINNKTFMLLGQTVGGIYYSSICWLLLTVISYIILRKTKFGIYTYSVGSNRNAANMSGINIKRVRISHFIISGALTAVASTFLLAWQKATTLNGGKGMEFDAVVSIVVGGTALSGGSGDTIGTASGSILMVLIVNGIYKYGIPSEYQEIAKGVIILLVVSYETIKKAISARKTKKKLYEEDLKTLAEEGENI